MKLDLSRVTARGAGLLTVDLHAAGEPLRLVVGGLPPMPGRTMQDKRTHLSEHLDRVRLLLTREPRGHRDMFAAAVTEPVSDGAAFGLVFMDARRYPYMCGHGVMAAVTAFVELGWARADGDPPVVGVDTPAGMVKAFPRIRKDETGVARVESVAVEMGPAFVLEQERELAVPGYGSIPVDVVFAGGFFVLASIERLGAAVSPDRSSELARLGMSLIEAGNRRLRVRHPERDDIRTVDVAAIYDPAGHGEHRGRGCVVLGEGHVDRSPCGTGTSAKMALLHRRGELPVGRVFENAGLTNIPFQGRIVRETEVGGIPAVVPEIRGSAWITGFHRFVTSPDDPFPEGFLV
ncbi:MAG: proline racemase family protein [Deltaproteobacteria bacterium]|nr:proline racemase family protein [Deltaproteobacteria bacterium]